MDFTLFDRFHYSSERFFCQTARYEDAPTLGETQWWMLTRSPTSAQL